MKTHHTFKLLALAGVLAASAPAAMALSYNGAQTQGTTAVADFSSTGLMSFDIDFATGAAATLQYTVSADDLSMPLNFNAMLRNFSGLGFGGYSLVLSKGSFTHAGSVTRQFSGTTLVTTAGGSATLNFNTPEHLDVEVGNALGTTPGTSNWQLGGLQAGDSFSISVSAVPEPGTYAMWLAGLLCMGWVTQRQRKQR